MTTSQDQIQNSIQIRPLELRDAHAASALVSQLGYRRSPAEIESWIRHAAAHSDQTALVACVEGEVAGWIEVSVERRLQTAPFALIGGLVVAKPLRSRGIGKLLCQAAEDWARGLGLQKLRVTSRSTREDAHRFYLRDGYQTVKTSMVFEKTLA